MLKMQHVKCKLIWDKISFYDLTNERVNKPPRLGGYVCNCVFVVKGKWMSHGQRGLCVERSDVQLVYPREVDYKSPFL